jgi:perosamine synthetase
VNSLSLHLVQKSPVRSEEWFHHSELGYNYRISEINCALGIEQMKRIESTLAWRETIARKYHERLMSSPHLKLPPLNLPRRRISWFTYVVRLGAQFSQVHRDWIWREMAKRGIGCARYFAPIHQQPIYQSLSSRRTDLAVTEESSVRSLALPFFNNIQEEQIDEVCQTLDELTRSIDLKRLCRSA